MVSISFTDRWQEYHPKSIVGILEVADIDNTGQSEVLNQQKRKIEETLRSKYLGFDRQDFNILPKIAAYRSYYKRFKKSYHVQLQLESITIKEKNLPNISPLVDANFMAEVEHLILTAGHDVAKLNAPIHMDVSMENQQIIQMNGTTKEMRAGDMVMIDTKGVCCSVIYGQDNRSPITRQTSHALYVAYAPVGVSSEDVLFHLSAIEKYVLIFSSKVKIIQKNTFTTG